MTRTRIRGSLAAAAALAVATVTLGACTGGGSNSNLYQYTSFTKAHTLIPAAHRKPAEQFSGQLLDGGTYRLSAYKGKAVVINFWGSWCGPCTTETPDFNTVYEKYRTKPVTFVGIDVKDSKGAARAFINSNHISYPIVFDETAETALRLGNVPANGLPFTILLDRQHRVAGVYDGIMNHNDLEPLLNQVVAGT